MDSRYYDLAKVLTGFSVSLKKGEKVLFKVSGLVARSLSLLSFT